MKVDPHNNQSGASDDFYRAISSDNALVTSFSQEARNARYGQTKQKSEAYSREGITPFKRGSKKRKG